MKRDTWRYFDFWLFGAVLILSIFGVAMIRSAVAGSPGLADAVSRQTIFLAIGLVVLFVVSAMDYHYWASLTRVMYIITMILLITVFGLGKAQFGATRWLDTGLILIQPSELAKIVMILVLANFFANTTNQSHDLRWVARSLLLTGGVVIWIFLQPSLSVSIVIMVIWFAMMWISGLPTKYILAFVIGILIIGVAIFPFLEDYQQLRVINFLYPNPNARYGNSYNVDQAMITIGSGGWFGMGYGHGTQVQLRFLKVRHTDYIFSALGEEFGFAGTVTVLGLIAFVILRCLRAARIAGDPYGTFISYGFAILIFFQTVVNVGVNLNLIPVTGLTLPFISYGGSSILSLLLGIGLVESVILRHRPLDF